MLQTCHLACIEDDSEREAFIQRVGAVTNVQAYRKLLTDRLAEHEWKLEVCRKLAEARGDDYFTTQRAAAEYRLLLEAFDRHFPP